MTSTGLLSEQMSHSWDVMGMERDILIISTFVITLMIHYLLSGTIVRARKERMKELVQEETECIQ